MVPIAVLVVLLVVGVGAVVALSGGDDGGEDDDVTSDTTGRTTSAPTGGDGPDDVALAYFEAAVDFDCEALVDRVDLSSAGASSRDAAIQECEDGLDPTDAEQDDYPVEMLGAEVTGEGASEAEVVVEYETLGGSIETQDFVMVNTDDGWKVDLERSFSGGGPVTTDEPTTTTSSTTTTTAPTTTTAATPPTTIAATPAPVNNPDAVAEIAENPDEDLTGWANACQAGDMAACDDLYWDTDVGGILETYAKSCGGRIPEGGYGAICESTFG